MWAGLVPSGGSEGERAPHFWRRPAILGVPWLAAASLPSLLLSPQGLPRCVRVQISLTRPPVIGLGVTLIQ